MDGDGRQGDANPIANREKLRKNNTTTSRQTCGTISGARSETPSPPYPFPAVNTEIEGGTRAAPPVAA
jgi:hypothetical protein